MEVVAFDVEGQRFGLEEDYARVLSSKLRELARGDYAADVVTIYLREDWRTIATSLADRIDQWRAEDRTGAITLERDGYAESAYAVLPRTYSDGWGSQQVSGLWAALREYLE